MIRPTMNSIPEKLESGAVPDDPSPDGPGPFVSLEGTELAYDFPLALSSPCASHRQSKRLLRFEGLPLGRLHPFSS